MKRVEPEPLQHFECVIKFNIEDLVENLGLPNGLESDEQLVHALELGVSGYPLLGH